MRRLPLSIAATHALRLIAEAPVPRCEVNVGITHRLALENLVEEVALPSKYKSRHGLVRHLQITAAGKDRLR